MKRVQLDRRGKEYTVCFKCDEDFVSDEGLKEHIEKVHVRKKEEGHKICPKCDKRCRDEEELREHVRVNHEDDCILYIIEKEEYKKEFKNGVKGEKKGRNKI